MKDLRTRVEHIVSLALYGICKTIADMDRTPSIPVRLQHFTVGKEDGDTTCAITVDARGIYLLFGVPGCAWRYNLKPHLSLQDVREEMGMRLLVDLLLQDPISMSIFVQRVGEIQSYLYLQSLDPDTIMPDPDQLIRDMIEEQKRSGR